MNWIVTSQPTIEPVTLSEMKLHLKIEESEESDDDLIQSLITTARKWCEGYQGRAYLEQEITAKLDRFSDTIPLPQAPLISVDSISYYDSNGTEQTLSTDIYDVITDSEPGIIFRKFSQVWPTLYTMRFPITIVYMAGYGDDASDVPDTVKSAIKLIVGSLYANREDTSRWKLEDIPFGATSLLAMERMYV